MEKQIWLVVLGFFSGWCALALAYVDSVNKSTIKVKRQFTYTWEETGFDEEKADAFFNIQQLLTNRMAITIDNDTSIMGSGLVALASANHIPQGVLHSPASSRGYSNGGYPDGPGAGGGALGPVYICGWLGGMGGQPIMFDRDGYY